MLIEALELEAVGPFRERLRLGPFAPGLNVLAQPNEWGKSTVITALSRAFFDRYTSRAEPIQRLRPAGSSLSPRITVAFEARGERFRAEKRFLEDKACVLSRWSGQGWERTDESDRADQRIRELLGAPALEGTTAKPETWGFIRYLWARQDDPADWPDWRGTSGDAARRKLATVSIDTMVRDLAARLEARGAAFFTATGKVKAGGALETAIETRKALECELADLRSKRTALEQAEQEFQKLKDDLPRLEREHQTRTEEATKLRAEAEAAEKLLAGIEQHKVALGHADTALKQRSADRDTLRELAEKARAIATERERLAGMLREIEAALPVAEDALQRLRADQGRRVQVRLKTDEKVQWIRGLLRLRRQAADLEKLNAKLAQTRNLAAELKGLEAALARLPKVTAKQLDEWRAWDRSLRDDKVRLEAMGLRVKLTPDTRSRAINEATGEPLELSPDQSATLHAAQSLRLRLEGWGALEIVSGAAEPAQLEAAIAARSRQLSQGLASAGLGSLEEAEAAAQDARDLDQHIRAARKALSTHLGEGHPLADLENTIATAHAALEREQLLLVPTEDEAAMSVVALEAEEQSLLTSLKSLAKEEESAEQWIETAAGKHETLRQQREAAGRQLATAEADLTGNSRQQEMIAQRYLPVGPDAMLLEAQSEFARAEARLADAIRQLPENTTALPGRSQRAAQAAAEVSGELNQKRLALQRAETQLEERGGDGLFEREAEAEEKLLSARAQEARLRTEGAASRLLGELIRRHEQHSIRTVLGPLEDRLSEVFAVITGQRDRRVWFDEQLRVRGIGRRADELVPFEELSRGAREQLLLALRAAIALELAAEERQCLILDDVLVHTDPARHENVLDYLGQLAAKLQIVVLTCHAERYRGAGHLLMADR